MKSRKDLENSMKKAMLMQPRTGSQDILYIHGEILLDIRELLVTANELLIGIRKGES